MSYLKPRDDELDALTVPCPACEVGEQFWCRPYTLGNHNHALNHLHSARFKAAIHQAKAGQP